MIIEDQCLGLVRSLGLAESHSANLRLGGRFRLKAHARDICSQVAGWYPSASLGSIEALKILLLLFRQLTKNLVTIPCENSIAFSHKFFGGSNYLS